MKKENLIKCIAESLVDTCAYNALNIHDLRDICAYAVTLAEKRKICAKEKGE